METKALIAITAYNRSDTLQRSLKQHELYSQGIDIFIHYDDFDNRIGIPASKNACIREFMSGDYTHLFLFDDDTYPIKSGWEEEYINSGLEHACYTFYPVRKRHGNYNEFRLANGCMMMVTRECIETVGGFDTDFGMGKYEHKEFSERVHARGLTPCKFLDIHNSSEYIYCLDQDKHHKRSMTEVEMNMLLNKNYPIYLQKLKNLRRFVEY